MKVTGSNIATISGKTPQLGADPEQERPASDYLPENTSVNDMLAELRSFLPTVDYFIQTILKDMDLVPPDERGPYIDRLAVLMGGRASIQNAISGRDMASIAQAYANVSRAMLNAGQQAVNTITGEATEVDDMADGITLTTRDMEDALAPVESLEDLPQQVHQHLQGSVEAMQSHMTQSHVLKDLLEAYGEVMDNNPRLAKRAEMVMEMAVIKHAYMAMEPQHQQVVQRMVGEPVVIMDLMQTLDRYRQEGLLSADAVCAACHVEGHGHKHLSQAEEEAIIAMTALQLNVNIGRQVLAQMAAQVGLPAGRIAAAQPQQDHTNMASMGCPQHNGLTDAQYCGCLQQQRHEDLVPAH